MAQAARQALVYWSKSLIYGFLPLANQYRGVAVTAFSGTVFNGPFMAPFIGKCDNQNVAGPLLIMYILQVVLSPNHIWAGAGVLIFQRSWASLRAPLLSSTRRNLMGTHSSITIWNLSELIPP